MNGAVLGIGMTEFASWLDVDENGMIDATKLSKQLGTTTRNYEKNDSNKAFFKALKEQLGKEVIVGGGKDGTTMPESHWIWLDGMTQPSL